ncbi:hypothetical protein GDO81_002475 [Engystomops pustulosus]|uniref:THAP-type domain-containing protein n=1 Tax=Engystomops pustulosus TaxID=76066 RepID=A0AAV7DKH3_ENGPU|nr:hypothetical protein GDO81_002475 [Engystomops pustulosus]
MPSCIVSGCIHKTTKRHYNEEGIIMHAFPCSLSRIKQWLKSIERNNHQYFGNIDALADSIFYKKNNSSFRICSDHFVSDCYSPGHSKRRALRQDATPTIFRAPLKVVAVSDTGSPQPVPFMVDAITQTDPYTNAHDKGAQWPEYEFNVGGQLWKIEHDHMYQIPRFNSKYAYQAMMSTANAEDNPFIYGIKMQSSARPRESVVINDSDKPAQEHTAYLPMFSDRESCMQQEPAYENRVKERKFIVFESCLDVLFEQVRCKHEDCNSSIVRTQKHVLGTYLSVSGQCSKGHIFHLWHSQPTRGVVALGNALSSAAVLFSGSNFHKVQEMCQLLGLQFISHNLYDLYQQKYLFPTVDIHWQQERLRLGEASSGTQVCLVGSGQCSSHENGSKYGIYTFLDVATKRIVDFETFHGTKANSCVALKRKAFVKCLNRILGDKFEVSSVATDYNPKIKRTCEQNYRIQHKYDAWQYTKNIEKRLLAASKKKNCSVIAEWIPSIRKHLWWCSGTICGNSEVLRELWQSVLMHVTDRHNWDHGEIYHACFHRPLTKLEHDCQPWIKENSEPYHALYDVVMNPKVLKDLDHLSQFLHTGEMEVYYHFVSKYKPRKVCLKMDAFNARMKLAALAHNANVHRQRAKANSTRHGKAAMGTVRQDKVTKSWSSKTLYGSSSNLHVLPIMTDVLKCIDCGLTNNTIKS